MKSDAEALPEPFPDPLPEPQRPAKRDAEALPELFPDPLPEPQRPARKYAETDSNLPRHPRDRILAQSLIPMAKSSNLVAELGYEPGSRGWMKVP